MGRFLFRFRLAVLLGAFGGILLAAFTQKRWADATSPWQRPVASWIEADWGTSAVLLVSGLLCVAAFALRTTSEARLRWVVYGQGKTKGLVDHGPFAWVRNPLYIGTWLFFFALAALWTPAVLWLSAAAVFFVAFDRIVRHEERILGEQLGAPYAAYLERVPRWLPRPPRARSEVGRPDLGAYGWAALGNLGLASLGLFRVGVALGVPARPLGVVNLACIALWLAVLVARRRRYGGESTEAR